MYKRQLIDPFGDNAVSDATRYWTPAEKNTLLIPVNNWLLLNRVIWISMGVLFLFVGMKKFEFSHVVGKSKKKKVKKKAIKKKTVKDTDS